MKSKAWTEKVMQGVFFIAACTSVLAVALICIFLFANGIPAIRQIGFVKFITGDIWRPGNELFGIFPMIIGSIYVTAGAIIFGVPIGILTSVFMAMYCPKKIYRPLKAATELLAGIPSVVYGFFGMVIVVPIIRDFGRTLKMMGLVEKSGDGKGILTTSIVLGMMILPTIIGTTESAMRAVPPQYYEGSLALGATQERSIFKVVIPAAKSGFVCFADKIGLVFSFLVFYLFGYLFVQAFPVQVKPVRAKPAQEKPFLGKKAPKAGNLGRYLAGQALCRCGANAPKQGRFSR